MTWSTDYIYILECGAKKSFCKTPFSNLKQHITHMYHNYDVASGSKITSCSKIYKLLVVYRFSGNVMASIKHCVHNDKIITFYVRNETSFIFYVFVLSCVCYVLCASVYMCFVVTCWERADLLALVCGVFCEFVTFPLVSWVRCGT